MVFKSKIKGSIPLLPFLNFYYFFYKKYTVPTRVFLNEKIRKGHTSRFFAKTPLVSCFKNTSFFTKIFVNFYLFHRFLFVFILIFINFFTKKYTVPMRVFLNEKIRKGYPLRVLFLLKNPCKYKEFCIENASFFTKIFTNFYFNFCYFF